MKLKWELWLGICIILNPFSENKSPVKKKIKLNVNGKNIFQPSCINWSNLKRGKLALTKIKIKVILIDLTEKIPIQNIELMVRLKNVLLNCLVKE